MSTSLKQGALLSGLFSRLTLCSSGQGTEKPPVPRLLKSNDPPSEAERIQIRTAISRAKERKHQLTEALKNTSNASKVAHINKAMKDVDTYINSHQLVLSPLRGLPQELLSLIFTICLEPITTNLWKRTNWSDLPSFPVSQVCQWWRTVALNTPQLWCILGDIQLNKKTKSKAYIKFLNALLSRSRGLDLWIYVYAPNQVFEKHWIIEPLIHHAERWGVVTFQTTPTTVNAFRGVKHRLLRLQRLSLDLGCRSGIIDCFSSAPVLTDFSLLNGVYYDSSIVPWRQLKSFSEEADDGSALGNIINDSSSELEILVLKFNSLTVFDITTSAANFPVTLSKLKTFHLILPIDSLDLDVESFFQIITLPCLEELRIWGFRGPFFESLIQLFRRSFQSLRHVPLKRLYLNCGVAFFSESAVHFVSLLRLVPCLQHLELELTSLFGLLNTLFKAEDDLLPIIPVLESLTVHWDWFGDYDHQVFGRLLNVCNRLGNEGTGLWNSRASGVEIDGHNRPLRQLRFMFKDRERAIGMQRFLNGWAPASAVHGDEYHGGLGFWQTSGLRSYERWRRVLLRELPALRGENSFHPTPKVAQRLDKVLEDIHNTELMDVHLLYGSSLHFTLRDLSQLNKEHVPQDDEYMFRVRASATLERWREAIKVDIENERSVWRKNWVLKGNRCLEYLANYDAIRESPHALGLIWGLVADSEEAMTVPQVTQTKWRLA